jgi:hypothetical protein
MSTTSSVFLEESPASPFASAEAEVGAKEGDSVLFLLLLLLLLRLTPSRLDETGVVQNHGRRVTMRDAEPDEQPHHHQQPVDAVEAWYC